MVLIGMVFLFALAIGVGIIWFFAWTCALLAKKINSDTTIAAIMGVIFGIYAVGVYFIVYLIKDNENNKLKEN